MSKLADPDAGPSRNPVKLLVKTRDPSSSSSLASASVKASLARKSEAVRKAEKWGDRMMEETLSPRDFKRGIKYITPEAYLEIQHERHLNHLCSYPQCPNPPRDEFRQGARYSISTARRSIKEVQGNREDGFCSTKCARRSAWIAEQLDRRRQSPDNAEEVILLEELPGEEEKDKNQPPSLALRPGARLRNSSVPGGSPSGPSGPSKNEKIGVSKLQSLLGDITIHERPTPLAPPNPPSLEPQPTPHPSASKATSYTSTSISHAISPTHAKSGAQSRRTVNSSMVATPTKLVSSILSSSRTIPNSQLPEDSDASESSLDAEEENPLGMGGWSEDEDVKALFEEARAARELIDTSSLGHSDDDR